VGPGRFSTTLRSGSALQAGRQPRPGVKSPRPPLQPRSPTFNQKSGKRSDEAVYLRFMGDPVVIPVHSAPSTPTVLHPYSSAGRAGQGREGTNLGRTRATRAGCPPCLLARAKVDERDCQPGKFKAHAPCRITKPKPGRPGMTLRRSFCGVRAHGTSQKLHEKGAFARRDFSLWRPNHRRADGGASRWILTGSTCLAILWKHEIAELTRGLLPPSQLESIPKELEHHQSCACPIAARSNVNPCITWARNLAPGLAVCGEIYDPSKAKSMFERDRDTRWQQSRLVKSRMQNLQSWSKLAERP